jgi:uncharacterized protein
VKLRGRPKKCRVVKLDPEIVYFSPRGKPGRPDEVEVLVDEFEALRLVDFAKKDQKTAALAMRISQQTLSRIVKRARFKVADSLVNGKILRIQGGKYRLARMDDLQEKTSVNSPKEVNRE